MKKLIEIVSNLFSRGYAKNPRSKTRCGRCDVLSRFNDAGVGDLLDAHVAGAKHDRCAQ
jgi:hypothetical protein